MPWSLSQRDGRWCVVKDSDGSVSGCHDSRADAIKQQRALYANESRVAAMYAELDARPEEPVTLRRPDLAPYPLSEEQKSLQASLQGNTLGPIATELIGLLMKDERERSLTASIAGKLDQDAEERKALVAALNRMGTPTINVAAPEVQVHTPETVVNVDVPAPEVKVDVPAPVVNVAPPPVNVELKPEIVMPTEERKQKTVTFERNLEGRVTGATIEE